ncbi:MAG: LysR family transcriptional regulator [Betaproteobacteria bacterium RBG_16_64_9]|nr:MAG: LysR family transcriptional regulator [Betaproteobacteria bacterium RBG_16_64_9]OGA94942.1 MAG: LysR family transcriptional regulator [Betaproteobacteria bacterium RIFCSPLOWO2_12_FULL_66_14]
MKSTLQPGLNATRRITIDKPRTVDFLGEALRVYATPELVRDFETACREFLLGFADAGEDSVGTGISITHSGATLLGMQVEILLSVARVEGRLVTFELLAKDGAEEISRGSHSRFVVDVEKLRSRVAAKAAKVAAS